MIVGLINCANRLYICRLSPDDVGYTDFIGRSKSFTQLTISARPIVAVLYINIKKLQFIQVLTASCIDLHVENSKNDKKVILTTITSPKPQCDAE